MKKKNRNNPLNNLIRNLDLPNNKVFDVLAILSILIFTIAGILVSLHRYWQYDAFYFDFGIFDQAIWSVSRFQAPIIEHISVGGKWIFADHFSPSIFLLTPLYWLTDRSEVLLIAQAIAVGLSGLILYKIGIAVLDHKFLSLSVLVSYLLFIGLQNAVISDFHEVTLMVFPLMITFFAIATKRVFLYFLFLVIVLGFKELTFALGIGIGLTAILLRREWLKIGFFTIVISSFWGYLSIYHIIPYFSEGMYLYKPASTISPLFFIDHPVKRETLFYSLLNFGFLPVLSPSHWLLIAQDYAMRFLSANCCTRWDLGLHYNAPPAAILAFSSLYGFLLIKRKKTLEKYMVLFGVFTIACAFFLYRFLLHGPFLLATNVDFYKHTKNFVFLDKMIKLVPKENVTVMTQNNLAVRFTHQKVWLLKKDYGGYRPDYILLDIRKGQNPNDFFGGSDPFVVLQNVTKDSNYDLIYKTEGQYVFKKKNKNVL